MKSQICHEGVIDRIHGKNVDVRIEAKTACASCHARNACLVVDLREKIIEADAGNDHYEVGERVELVMNEHLGYEALLWSYLFPLIILLVALFGFQMCELGELSSGFYSVLLLGAYYIILWMNRHRFKQRFIFKIKR